MNMSTKEQNYCDWSKTTFGNSLLGTEQIEINNILPNFLGNYLIKIGGPKQSIFLQTSPIRQKIYLINNKAKDSNSNIQNYDNNFSTTNIIQCDYTSLPLLCESIDVAVIHHALEFAQNPRAILEETAQALTPQGHLIIIGFNPRSLLGLQHYFTKKNNSSSSTSANFKQARFISAKYITEWLTQLNFAITKHITCYFRPYSQHSTILHSLQPLEKIGKLLNIKCGACYIFVAEKKVLGVTPIKDSIVTKQLSFGYLKPSPQVNRSQSQ